MKILLVRLREENASVSYIAKKNPCSLLNICNDSGQKPKAYGVYFRDSNGIRHMAYLNNGPMNEIILSSGALGSPQLLMLSGIGPANQLKAQGIKVILDQPNVGQGMSDNPMNAVFIPSPRPVELSLIQVVGITQVGSFIEAASGFFELVWARGMAQEVSKFENQVSSLGP